MFTDSPRFRWIGGMAAAVLAGALLLVGGRCARGPTLEAAGAGAEVRLRVENLSDAPWSLEFRGAGDTRVERIGPRQRTDLHFAPGTYRVTQTLLSAPTGTGSRMFESRLDAGAGYRWTLLTARSEPSSP